MAAESGARFGRYRIVRRIGDGSSGSVHLAVDDASGQALALKTLPLADDDARQRFHAETQALARLEHPDIVSVLDAGQTPHTGWLAMELLAGCDLRRYTRTARLLPEPLVLTLGARLALALAHAHGRGVVHRDLKPSNVMVDWAAGRVTLTDFGLARLDDAAQTKSGIVAGSPDYMAPELLAGGAADARSDVYALGVLLFELLSGRRPHVADSLGRLLHLVASAPAPDLRSLRPELPAPLAVLLAAMLGRRPAERPADLQALAAQLHEVAAAVAAAPR